LQPDAAEVHFGRGVVHYFANRDFPRALEELKLARRSLPNDAEILRYIGYNERRQGQFPQALVTLGQAVSLDPRNVQLVSELAATHHLLRQYADERRVLSTIRAWQPHDFAVLLAFGDADADEKADLAGLQSALSGELAAAADANTVANRRLSLALWRRDYPAAEKALSEYRRTEMRGQGFVTPREYYEGRVANGLGDGNRADAAFQRARERAAEAVHREPNDGKALSVLALIEAALQRKDEAMRAAQAAVQLLPVSTDAVAGATVTTNRALVYAEVGEADRAFEALKEAVVLPHGLHYGQLKFDDRLDPIRADPRFEQILAVLAPKASVP
jgi:tetratricopeptide (TPR) repeat protein